MPTDFDAVHVQTLNAYALGEAHTIITGLLDDPERWRAQAQAWLEREDTRWADVD